MITTTLNRIRAHKPCVDGWSKLLAGLGKKRPDDEPLPYATILCINGLEDALWATRVEPEYAKEWRLFAIWCARRVQHFMADPRSIAAIDVAERYAHGEASDGELYAARDAAWGTTRGPPRAAAWAAARDAAWDAAWAAAQGVAWAAAQGAAQGAAWAAAWGTTRGSARDAERAAQTAEFLRVVGGAA